MLHRLSKVEREGVAEFTGRLYETWQFPETRHSRSVHGKRKVGISQATAALGSALIEGAAKTLLLSPTLGSHKMKFSLWGKSTSRTRHSTDHRFPHSAYS